MSAAQLWWYVARSGGLVAWGLLTASVIWGLLLSTKALGRRVRAAWLLDLHRFLGGAALAFTGIHAAALVADSTVHFELSELLVPLASTWRPVAVAWGVVAAYLLVAVEITSLLRRRLPRRWWRRTHMASLPLWALATVHGLTAGTDAANPVVLGGAVLGIVAVLTLALIRLTPAPVPDRTPV